MKKNEKCMDNRQKRTDRKYIYKLVSLKRDINCQLNDSLK
ncbi:hypothetical protein CLOSYM_03408 [[Clostridium] symbiosum ATCC 14940]|uniref:Uncharacterized protein n=1 Tax=[Clostridium] symbiosum ATCC 14940 TaxID=411472 RepID=A0ABC9TUP2_CLOSY|nr:hypothetical protein CLOSYM_03408 [[Clostridium] symbiosum ATCC 14940]